MSMFMRQSLNLCQFGTGPRLARLRYLSSPPERAGSAPEVAAAPHLSVTRSVRHTSRRLHCAVLSCSMLREMRSRTIRTQWVELGWAAARAGYHVTGLGRSKAETGRGWNEAGHTESGHNESNILIILVEKVILRREHRGG